MPRLHIKRSYRTAHRAFLVCAGLVGSQAAADVVIGPGVLDAVESGRARIVVELRLPGGFHAEGGLTQERVQAQREAIAESQTSVLSALAAEDARLVRRPTTVPFLALEVGPQALAKLRTMPEQIARVLEDQTAAAQ